MSEQGKDQRYYERLSHEAVDKLHQNFINNINARAEKAIKDSGQDFNVEERDSKTQELAKLLILSKRCREDLSATRVKDLLCGGDQALDDEIKKYDKELNKDPWSFSLRRALNKEFKKRREAPLVMKTFGDDKRIYLKLKPIDITKSETYQHVAFHLGNNGYKITDYIKGYASDAAGKQQFKIGKLLKDNAWLLEQFRSDERRSGQDRYVVISRNKQDLERMSTNRGWSSCMASNGIYRNKVPKIVGSMTLVAYLITENDPEINNPLARLLLKPFDNREAVNKRAEYRENYRPAISETFQYWASLLTDKIGPPQEENIAFGIGRTYGFGSQDFKLAVSAFCQQNLHKVVPSQYRLNSEIYSDGMSSCRVVDKHEQNFPEPEI